MNHLCEMNFLVVVSVPFTTKSWLLLKGELCKDADACTKCLTLPEVSGSLGPCISLPSLNLTRARASASRIQGGGVFPWICCFSSLNWSSRQPPSGSPLTMSPYCSETSLLISQLLFCDLVSHLVSPRRCC